MNKQPQWLMDYRGLAYGILCLAILGILFRESLVFLVESWINREEYSHGPLIPLISAYLIWMKRFEIRAIPSSSSSIGVFLVIAGIIAGEE